MSAAKPMDWMPEGLIIPGLDPQATVMLGMLIERAVSAGVTEALDERDQEMCDRRCDRVEKLSLRVAQNADYLHGEPDSESGGIIGRVRDLESRMKLLLWLAGTSGGAAIVALVGLIITLARGG